MLDRSEVKRGGEYLLNGMRVVVYMIHKPNAGESITLADDPPAGTVNLSPYSRPRTMPMRKFQKLAVKIQEYRND